jgi:hypothetical protein
MNVSALRAEMEELERAGYGEFRMSAAAVGSPPPPLPSRRQALTAWPSSVRTTV